VNDQAGTLAENPNVSRMRRPEDPFHYERWWSKSIETRLDRGCCSKPQLSQAIVGAPAGLTLKSKMDEGTISASATSRAPAGQ